MKCKHIRLIMELIFIFILPLVFMCFSSEIQIERNFEYDNNGNYETSQETDQLSFDNSIIKYQKNEINANPLNNNIFSFNGEYIQLNDNNLPSKIYTLTNENNTKVYEYIFNYYYENVEDEDEGEDRLNINLHILNNYIYWGNNNINQKVVYQYNNNIVNNYYEWDLIFEEEDEGDKRYDVDYYSFTISSNTIVNSYTLTIINGPTIWGNIKNIIIDYLDVNDNVLLDILLCYLFIWFFHFLIWHTFYRFFDWIFHLNLAWGKDNE